ncbi:MAG: TlyA family RNA methyltransferase [Chloroflexota bacterium]|nr:TlyA family RNA methyltransferase [Chloroflexota bacterium]
MARRLDELLVERGLCEDHDQAMRRVMAGEVLVGRQVAITPGMLVDPEAELRLRRKPRYVGRGGLKLEAALNAFDLDLGGKVVADGGASTGGFTDCALQHGAERVYAIDVATGVLAWSLRTDPRVVVMEGVNAMHLEKLPKQVDLVTVDLSFTPLRLVLPRAACWLKPWGEVIALIKPQYEAESHQLVEGVVIDPIERRRIVARLLRWMRDQGWAIQGLIASPIRGGGGNREYLIHLRQGEAASALDDGEIEGRALKLT